MIKSFNTKFTDNEVESWPGSTVGVKMEYYNTVHSIASPLTAREHVAAPQSDW